MIETKRLLLRKFTDADLPELYDMSYSPFVMQFNMLKPLSFAEFAAAQAENDDLCIVLKTGELIGQISLREDKIRHGVQAVNLSYWLGEKFVRQGYMFEALQGLLPVLFAKKIEVITARVFSPNTGSQKLLEKLGFQQEAYLQYAVKKADGVIFDDLFYVLFHPQLAELLGSAGTDG